MKSKDRWYRVDIDFRGNKNYVLPILEEYWNIQEGADRIIRHCGCGIMMVFKRVLTKDIDHNDQFAGWLNREETDADTNMGAWYNGEQFDHSSNACLSPIVEHMSKMVLAKRGTSTPIKESFATKAEAVGKFKYKHIYVWDGGKWSYELATGQAENNPFKRKGNRWGRN